MKVMVKVYDISKYDANSKKVAEVEYDISGYAVKEIGDEEIFGMGFDEVDPHGEYLILTLANGDTATFKNSLCDMFRV